MAELADALDSGSSESNFMKVQVLLSAPTNDRYRTVSVFCSSRHFDAEPLTRRRRGIGSCAALSDSLAEAGARPRFQVLLPAPNSTNPNPKPVGEGFGFVVYFDYPNFNLKKEKPN